MLLLIDGDVMGYTSCTPIAEFRKKEQDHYDTIKVDENGHKVPLVFTEEEAERYLESSKRIFKSNLNALKERFWTDDFLMAVKGPGNYRDELYKEYKAKRGTSPKPYIGRQFVPLLREWMVSEGYAIPSTGREADDLLRMWALQATEVGDPYIICSIDKDLKCIPGTHFNLKTKEVVEMSPLAALKHYYAQLIAGDPTDNIPGIPGVAMITAQKILRDVHTEKEFQEAVVGNYIAAFGEDWESMLLSNGKMIHIQGHEHDFFTIKDWEIVKELR